MAHYYSTTVKLTAANTLYPRRVYMENHKAYLVLTHKNTPKLLPSKKISISHYLSPKKMLHHIEIYVSDLQRSRQFYNWFFAWLGYELSSDWNEGFSYRFDNSYYLVFVQTEPQHLHHIYHRKQTGLNHLAFAAASREKVDELTQLLTAKGIPILYADKHPFAGGKHYYAVFFEDPDRIKLEVAVKQ